VTSLNNIGSVQNCGKWEIQHYVNASFLV